MTRYRRRPLEREEEAAALATSVVLGAGVAAVAFYVVRLLLSRDPLSGSGAAGDPSDGSESIEGTEGPERALPAGERVPGR